MAVAQGYLMTDSEELPACMISEVFKGFDCCNHCTGIKSLPAQESAICMDPCSCIMLGQRAVSNSKDDPIADEF